MPVVDGIIGRNCTSPQTYDGIIHCSTFTPPQLNILGNVSRCSIVDSNILFSNWPKRITGNSIHIPGWVCWSWCTPSLIFMPINILMITVYKPYRCYWCVLYVCLWHWTHASF